MTLASPTAGEFRVPLIGVCRPPKPQGPFEILKGAGTIPFRNVFPKAAEFAFTLDNPSFVVKPSETIAPKKTVDISVTVKKDAIKLAVGRLTVSCLSEECPPWVFYLKAL